VLPRFRHIVGKLHAEKVVHVRAERVFDAQGHFRRQRGLAVQKIGERGAAPSSLGLISMEVTQVSWVKFPA
jgi:hypothetical protein